MGQAIIGFFGSIVTAVVALAAIAGFLTFLVLTWKSGSLPTMMGWVGTLLSGLFQAVVGFFGFLRELLLTAREA